MQSGSGNENALTVQQTKQFSCLHYPLTINLLSKMAARREHLQDLEFKLLSAYFFEKLLLLKK